MKCNPMYIFTFLLCAIQIHCMEEEIENLKQQLEEQLLENIQKQCSALSGMEQVADCREDSRDPIDRQQYCRQYIEQRKYLELLQEEEVTIKQELQLLRRNRQERQDE